MPHRSKPTTKSESTTSLSFKSLKPALHRLPQPRVSSARQPSQPGRGSHRIWPKRGFVGTQSPVGAGVCPWNSTHLLIWTKSQEGRAVTLLLLDNTCLFSPQVMSFLDMFLSCRRNYRLLRQRWREWFPRSTEVEVRGSPGGHRAPCPTSAFTHPHPGIGECTRRVSGSSWAV